MPDDVVALDEHGSEFIDLEAARQAVPEGASDLVCEQGRNGRLNLDHYMEIAGQTGHVIETIHFRDAFEFRYSGRPRNNVAFLPG